MIITRGKSRKNSKNKMQIPQGGVTRPPSQFESYSLSASSKSYSGRSYSAPKPGTRDLDDLSCTRCAPTIASRPSRKYIFNKHKLSVYWVLKYRVGGRVRNFVWLRVQSSVSGQDKGNESFLLLTKVIKTRNTKLAFLVMADGFVCRG